MIARNLKCLNLREAIGIVDNPDFSWEFEECGKKKYQESYRIIVSEDRESISASEHSPAWDSGTVKSTRNIKIPYEGESLKPGTCYNWKVLLTDSDGNNSGWSESACFTTGITDRKLWKAEWIGSDNLDEGENITKGHTRLSARYLRKEFNVGTKSVKDAKVYISGPGLSELYINGERIGDHVLSPALSEYTVRVYYVVHDIREFINTGNNTIGVILGNGRFLPPFLGDHATMRNYGFPCLYFQMSITYDDGSEDCIISDESWKVNCHGPIVANNEYDGEEYDSAKELGDWFHPGYDDNDWDKVTILPAPSGNLRPQQFYPVRKESIGIPPVILVKNKSQVVFDMGRNLSGWVKVSLRGEKGSCLTIRYAEDVFPDGSLNRHSLSEARSTDSYILGGLESESWEPSFTIHGFRYVEFSGSGVDLESIKPEAYAVHDDLPETGHFESSDKLLNDIYSACKWGFKTNYRTIPTDETARSERLGYLGDRSILAHSESFVFDVEAFYIKWLEDIRDSQSPEGSIPQNCPPYWEYYMDDVTWPSAYFTIPDMLYRQYGNEAVLIDHYPGMKKWWNYMKDKYRDENGLMPRDFLGDWVVPPSEKDLTHTGDPFRITEGNYLGTSFFIYITGLLSKFAAILGYENESKLFAGDMKKQKEDFFRYYLDEKNRTISNNTPTANLLALAFDLVPGNWKDQIRDNLLEGIETVFNNHIPVGMIGLKFLMKTLTDIGEHELAYKIAVNTTYPSWGHMISKGATTIWELWNGDTNNEEMNSRNNPMNAGDLVAWLYEDVAGIKNAGDSTAFRELDMCPGVFGELEHISASYNTPSGIVRSRWKYSDNNFRWEISIPPNCSAHVRIPASDPRSVKENGILLKEAEGIEIIEESPGYTGIRIHSGNYYFSSSFIKEEAKETRRLKAPVYLPSGDQQSSAFDVNIEAEAGSTVFVTYNGEKPGDKSEKYKGPVCIKGFTVLRARAYKSGKWSFTRYGIFDVYNEEQNGLNYEYFEGDNWSVIPDMDKLEAVKTGISHDMNIKNINRRNDFWAIRFTGFLSVPVSGEYKLYISSDDGSRLFVDNTLLIDNDGIHPAMERPVKIYLEKGKHPVKIEYFQATLGYSFNLKIKGPGIPKIRIPRSFLFTS